MGKIIVTGASDDLVEIDGDIREEFSFYSDKDNETRYLVFSDGTVLSVLYDNDGIWRFNIVYRGTAVISKKDGVVSDDTMDVVTLDGDIKWVCFGNELAKK